MKKALIVALCLFVVPFVACTKDTAAPSGEPGTAAAPATAPAAAPAAKPAGGDHAKALDELGAKIAAAKTKEEFSAAKDACLELTLKAATSGTDLDKDAKYVEVCKVKHTLAQAEAAIAGSKPDAESPLCMGASMAVETLLEEKVALDKVKPVADKLNKACGYGEEDTE